MGVDVRLCAQPTGQMEAECYTQQRNEQTEQRAYHKSLAYHLTGVGRTLGAQQMCHLHPISGYKRTDDSLK